MHIQAAAARVSAVPRVVTQAALSDAAAFIYDALK